MKPRYVGDLIFLGIFLSAAAIECLPEVNTNVGKFVGTVKQVDVKDTTYDVKIFLGIPYAKSPVGNLRFMKPKPADVFTTVYSATSDRGFCSQHIQGKEQDNGHLEDCLYLNIYVPDRLPDGENGAAVMISLHEDIHKSNPDQNYDPSLLSAFGNVIVVTISYRTGIFAFVDLETEDGKGKLGFWDQHLALKWINKHITAFGGDRNRITLLGQSDGETDVLQHGFFPKNQNLIHRIIPQSLKLPIFNLNLARDTPVPSFQSITVALGCDRDDHRETAECLQSADTVSIIQTTKLISLGRTNKTLTHFQPNNDKMLVSKISGNRSELNDTQFTKVEFYRSLDMLIGFNSNDGFVYSSLLSSNMKTFKPSKADFKTVCLEAALKAAYLETEPLVSEIIAAEYTGEANSHDFDFIRQKCIELLTDLAFSVESVKAAILHTEEPLSLSSTFVYQFSASPTAHVKDTPTRSKGPALGDELPFLFGLNEGGSKAWELNLSRDMMTYWTNFVKSG